MNTHAKGSRAEKRAVAELEAEGYWAYQTHLSRGPFDIVAGRGDYFIPLLGTKSLVDGEWVQQKVEGPEVYGDIRFIQVKATKFKKRGDWPGFGRPELRKFAANVPSNCSVELWVAVDRQPEWHKEVIT